MDNQQTVGQRFSLLIQALGMSKNAFAVSLDKTATVIQHIVEERNKPGFDLLCKVFEIYPNVSKDWLMQGSGVMFSNEKVKSDVGNKSRAAADEKPEVPAPAQIEPSLSVRAADALSGSVAQAAPASLAAIEPTEVQPAAKTAPVVPVTPVAEASAAVESQSSAAPAATSVAPQGWEAALFAQQLQHQLALSELRNQHLLEQQKMLQQMVELLRQPR